MIFLTVGTYPIPFDRLIKAIDIAVGDGMIEENIFAQIGVCNYKPQNMKYVSMLEKGDYDLYLQEASSVISHAGIGTITIALDYNKPILVMPRMKRLKEHVNDHQVATARKFESLGHVLAVYKTEDLLKKIKHLKTFMPRKRSAQPQAVADRITKFLNELRIKG